MTRSHLAALRFSIPWAAVAAFVASAPVLAQESTTRGLHVGFHLTGATLDFEDGSDRADGAGVGITVGYGVNRTVMPFLQLEGTGFAVEGGRVEDDAVRGDWTMGHLDLGARFHFASTLRMWVPYLQAALSGRAVSVADAEFRDDTDVDVSFNGGGFSFGGGLMVYPWETVAFDLQLMFTGGEFTEIEVENVTVSGLDIEADSGRFSLGAVWWP
jgi:hypothetical protein